VSRLGLGFEEYLIEQGRLILGERRERARRLFLQFREVGENNEGERCVLKVEQRLNKGCLMVATPT